MDRKTAIKLLHQSHLVWACPECQTKFEGQYGSVIRSRWRHRKSHHPEKSTALISGPKITIFEVSHELPQDQQAWSCPLCTAALIAFFAWSRPKAKKHCQNCHPDHSIQDNAHLNKKNRKNPKNARKQREKWVKYRKHKFKTHEPVEVAIPERQQRKRGTANERLSHNVYCRKCLTWLNSKNGISPLMTCAKRRKLFRENKSSQLPRRNLWIRIKKDSHNMPKITQTPWVNPLKNLMLFIRSPRDKSAGPHRLMWVQHWQADLTCHGDIHPHPGPRTQPVSAWSCNVACGSGAWEFAKLASKNHVRIISIQDDGLTPSERMSSLQFCEKLNYRVYPAPVCRTDRNFWGAQCCWLMPH